MGRISKPYRFLFPVYNHIRNFIRVSKQIIGRNNLLMFNNIFLSKSFIKIKGNNNFIKLGKATKVSNLKINVIGNNNIINVEDDCIIKSTELWIEDDNCKIYIGKGTTIESAHFAATENNSMIRIGEDCMFAKQIVIRTGDSHSIIDMTTQERLNFAKNVVIGDHVWVGEKSIILKGVIIGNNSIVGTSSLLTKSVTNNTLVGGIPARILKQNVDWKRERISL